MGPITGHAFCIVIGWIPSGPAALNGPNDLTTSVRRSGLNIFCSRSAGSGFGCWFVWAVPSLGGPGSGSSLKWTFAIV